MRMNRRQMQTLGRYPFSARVWGRNRVRLAKTTLVIVSDNTVCVVRRQSVSA